MSSKVPVPGDTVIAVMGVTGAGKSSFIKNVTGNASIQIGHGLDSQTQVVEVYISSVNGQTVFFIDTPGFDDTNDLDDADILEMIAQKLQSISNDGIQLTSILYLHKITDNRFTGSSKRLQRVFERVCGPQAYNIVMLGTTMWSDLARIQDGISRETALIKDDFWGKMIRKGTATYRLDNTSQSAMPLAKALAGKQGATVLMQDELYRENGRIVNTSAGRELDHILTENINRAVWKAQQERDEEWKAEIERLRAEQDKLRSTNIFIKIVKWVCSVM